MAILNMQTMRYINLLDKTSRVRTTNCFTYNNTIFFAVDARVISKAIGNQAGNIKKIQEQLGKKVKIIKEARSIEDVQRFVEDIVEPVKFKSLDLKDDMLVLSAGMQSKAALIGRNRRREEELRRILMDNFQKEFKIV